MKHLFSRQVSGTHSAAIVMGVFTVVSQLLALIRDRVFAEMFGSGHVLDVYYASFRVPDLIFILLGSIVSVSVLIPLFSKAESESNERMRKVFSEISLFFGIVSSAFVIIAAILMPYIVTVLFPSSSLDFKYEVVLLSRIMLASPLLLGLSSIVTSYLQVQRKFFITSLQPILYNVGIILGGVVLYPHFGIKGLAMGVVGGALMHALIPFLVNNTPITITNERFSLRSMYQNVVKHSLPRTLSLSMSQILTTFGLTVVALAGAGAITRITWANNIYSVPLSIIGVSYSMSAFSVLSKLSAENNEMRFNEEVKGTVRWVFFLTIPIALVTIAFSEQIVLALLGNGAAASRSHEVTGVALSVLALGLPTACMTLVLTRTYYALGKTLTPFIAQLIGFCIGFTTLAFVPRNEVGVACAFLTCSLATDLTLFFLYVRDNTISISRIFKFLGSLLVIWIPTIALSFWIFIIMLTVIGGDSKIIEVAVALFASACALGIGAVSLRKSNLPEYDHAARMIHTASNRVRRAIQL